MQIVRLPPGPPGRRLIGNTYDYDLDRLGFLQRCQRVYGDAFRFSKTTTVVQDPDLIHELFARTNTDFRTEAPLFSGGDRVERMTTAIPASMAARRKGWHGMNRSIAAAHGARFVTHLDTVLASVADREIDPLPVLKSFFGLAVADFCLGGDAGGVTEVAGAVDAAATAAVAVMESSLTLPRWLPVPRVRRAQLAGARIESILHDCLEHRRRSVPADEPRDLLDVLLSPSGPQLADDVVIRTLEAVLRASHGVPGATLTWALRELAADPCLVDRIRAEAGRIDTALTSTAVEPSDLPYTEALVKELLRVYPPTWLMGRTVLRPARLGEWQFPAGHQVMFSPYLSHRDPRWWPEPDRFRPERWLEANRPYQGQAYYPFGAGPRICLGNQVGMLQLTLAIARLADRYEVLSGNLDQAKPDPRALLVPKGLRIRLVPRRN